MNVVLDTCAFIWAVTDPEALSPRAKKVLTDEYTVVHVSPISCAEIACAVQSKRLHIEGHWKPWFRHYTELNGWTLVDIDLATIEEAFSLQQPFHRDPADRIIVACARRLSAGVVTADQKMIGYPHVETIW